ncbi:hypothetical protein GGR51DRAFT_514554, partial [Nemania sp. FL0031]
MHSYGGLVGSEATLDEFTRANRAALNLPGGVVHMFYFAAFILQKCQTVLGVFGESENNETKPGGRFTMKNPAKIIYDDLPDEEAKYWESKIVDQSFAVQTTEMTRGPQKKCPSTYVLCKNDHGPPPHIQELWAEAAGSKLIKIDSGHSPMLSRTEELTGLIDVAAKEAMESL